MRRLLGFQVILLGNVGLRFGLCYAKDSPVLFDHHILLFYMVLGIGIAIFIYQPFFSVGTLLFISSKILAFKLRQVTHEN